MEFNSSLYIQPQIRILLGQFYQSLKFAFGATQDFEHLRQRMPIFRLLDFEINGLLFACLIVPWPFSIPFWPFSFVLKIVLPSSAWPAMYPCRASPLLRCVNVSAKQTKLEANSTGEATKSFTCNFFILLTSNFPSSNPPCGNWTITKYGSFYQR